MSEIVTNVIVVLLTTIVLPLITYLGVKVNQYIQDRIKGEKARRILTNISDLVNTNVSSIFQTFVQELKESNTFDKEAQNDAFVNAREQIFNSLNLECKKFISENFGDINQWITAKIEATIYELKKN